MNFKEELFCLEQQNFLDHRQEERVFGTNG